LDKVLLAFSAAAQFIDALAHIPEPIWARQQRGMAVISGLLAGGAGDGGFAQYNAQMLETRI
jgi:hypothetical protein